MSFKTANQLFGAVTLKVSHESSRWEKGCRILQRWLELTHCFSWILLFQTFHVHADHCWLTGMNMNWWLV